MSRSPHFALRSAAWLLTLALVALPVVGVMQGWFAVGRWPLRQLRIDGPFEHVSTAQVQGAVRPHAAPGFFAVRLDEVRTAVEKLPWVGSVDVRKRWPDVLEVRLRERSAAAVWLGAELVDVEGELFPVPRDSVPPGLPRFAGPRPRVREVLDFYREVEPQLGEHAMQLAAVQMSRRGGWLLRLTDGTELMLGSKDARTRLARFLAVQAPLADPSSRMARVDLRYANGFAVAWQPVPVSPAPGVATDPITPTSAIAPAPEAAAESLATPVDGANPSPDGRGVGERGGTCANPECKALPEADVETPASPAPHPRSHPGPAGVIGRTSSARERARSPRREREETQMHFQEPTRA